MENEPLQRCDNCLKDIPQSKIATHFGYCRRNIKKCPQCHEMYDINFKEEHDEEFHRQQKCPHCNQNFPSNEFKTHQKNCTQKPKYCQYCDLNVPVNTYPTHLKACEARTKPCTKCNLPITNKEYLVHIVSCEGPREQPKPTRNYQQHIQQQRRVIEQNSNNLQKVNSREKVNVPTYQSRNVQYKDYAPNADKRNIQQPKVISYNPPPRQQYKVEERKEYQKQPSVPVRVEPKRQQIRRYPTAVNPPPVTFTNNTKKEDPKPIGRMYPSQIPSQPASLSSNINRNDYGKGNGIREPIKPNTRSRQQQPASYKDINPKVEISRGVGGIKQSKSIERKYVQHQVPRREQKPTNLDYVQTAYYQKVKAPEPKQRVIYQEPRPQPRPQNNPYQRQHQPQGFGVQDDPQLQMAIMQSLGQGSKASKNSSYAFQNEEFNQSFIEEQKAIQAQLKKNRKR